MTIRWSESAFQAYRQNLSRQADGYEFKTVLPLRLRSTANLRVHHMVRHRWAQEQREAVKLALRPGFLPQLPAKVTITRLGGRSMDSDNLTISAKAIRDAVAEVYGVDDASDLYQWEVRQEKAKAYGVRIEVERR